MILSDAAIAEAITRGSIKVDPYEPRHLNPASLDLTLGSGLAVYDPWVWQRSSESIPEDGGRFKPADATVSVRDPLVTTNYTMSVDRGWVLVPGVLYLMHTAERIGTKDYVPVLDGKSSIARLGVQVHLTAGFGDPGWEGQFTLEVMSAHPVRVFPGMRICQIRFHRIEGEVAKLYDGNYTGTYASGAQPSRVRNQLR